MTVSNTMQIRFNFEPDAKITKLIKEECQGCKINKIYAAARTDTPSEPFKVTALFDGKEVVILEGDRKDYHMELLTDVVAKYFYNLDFEEFQGEMTAEVFNFVRRIPPNEWKLLIEKIKSVRSSSQKDLEEFDKGDLNQAIFKEEDWPALALKSYFQGKLSRDRIVLLLLYDMCLSSSHRYGSVNMHELKQADGKINQEAKNLVENFFLRAAWNNVKKAPTEYDMPFKDQDWQRLEELMKDWTTKESQFLVFNGAGPYRFDPEADPFYQPLFGETQGLHPFIAGSTNTILPTNLINAVLTAKYAENAMKQNPVLSYSQRDDFAHKTKRDALIPCRYLSMPEKLHGETIDQTRGLNFYHHDNAHQLIESSNKDRPLLLKLAAELEKKRWQNTLNLVLDRNVNLKEASLLFLREIAQQKDAGESLPFVIEFMLNSSYSDVFRKTIQTPEFQKMLSENRIGLNPVKS